MINWTLEDMNSNIIEDLKDNEEINIPCYKEEYENLTQLIHAYKLSKAAPRQITGDDTEEGSGLTTKTHPYQRTLNT